MPPETVLPSKLPSYHPPAVMRIQTPSPPPAPGNINNSVVAAIGCEIIVRDMIPTQGHKKCGTSDEVEKAASKLGTEVDAMHKELDDMHRRTRQGFAAANQKFDLMNTNMSVLTSTLSPAKERKNTHHTKPTRLRCVSKIMRECLTIGRASCRERV